MTKPTPEERKAIQVAKVKRSNAHASCRRYLEKRDFAGAERYAAARGFTVAEARLTSFDQGASLPRPMVTTVGINDVIVMPKPVTKDDPAMVNGWPMVSEAEVWGYCRNKRLVLIHLSDTREAAMWTTGRRWRIGTRLRVALESADGDPRYNPIEGSIQ